MVWTLLWEGTTDFNWWISPVTSANLLKVTHVTAKERGTLIGLRSGRTEIAQFDEAGESFSEPKIIRTEAQTQIILFPKLAIFARRRIGIRNGLGFDPQRLKVEVDTVPIFYEQNQSNASVSIAKTIINRRNVVQDIVPANNNRKGLTVKNSAKKNALIRLDADATVSDFDYILAPGATLELSPVFLGRISVFFEGSNASNPSQTFAGETLSVMEFL